MNKKFLSAVLAAALLAVAGCAENIEPNEAPTRAGLKGFNSAEFALPESVEELMMGTDLIADVTVTEWLGDNSKGWGTFFTARVNSVIASGGQETAGDTIKFSMLGTVDWTFEFAPLFKNGDRFLSFFTKVPPEDVKELGAEFEDCYSLNFIMLYDVLEYGDKTYLLERTPHLTEYAEMGGLKGKRADDELTDILAERFNKIDPIFAEIDVYGFHKYAFEYGDVTGKLLEESKGKVGRTEEWRKMKIEQKEKSDENDG
jgi:hypothetical protein